MRIATLGLVHEANTFSPILADHRLYDDGGVLRGEEIVGQHATAATTMGGFLAAGRWPNVTVDPLVFAYVNPIGPITREVFDQIVGEMLERLESRGPWDAVLLALHGAAVAEHIHDADGEIARQVRETAGPDVPVGATLDLHANISRRLVEALTVTTVYQTNPHVDAFEQASTCAELIVRTARGEIAPKQALVEVPVVVNIARQDTSERPMAGLIAAAADAAKRPGMLWAGVVEGFPYADVPHMGMSCVAIHDGDRAVATSAAAELAAEVWSCRDDLQARGLSVAEALDIARREPHGPVVLLDVGDNIGGGAPGDSTEILAAAVRGGIRSLVQTLWDPESVRRCVAAGAGAQVTLTVGACHPHSAGRPVPVAGRVRRLSDGRFEDPTPTHGGLRFHDMGLTAVVDTTDGHTLVLTSKQTMNSSLRQLLSVGIDPEWFQVIVAKGVNSPRAAYGPIASRMLVVDTEGITAMDLGSFTYRNRRKPLYPFEPADFRLPA